MLENFAKLQFIIHISNTQTNKVINRKKMQFLITFACQFQKKPYICNAIRHKTKQHNTMKNLIDLIVSFSKANGCTFVRIKDYTNAQGEVQDVTINVGVS